MDLSRRDLLAALAGGLGHGLLGCDRDEAGATGASNTPGSTTTPAPPSSSAGPPPAPPPQSMARQGIIYAGSKVRKRTGEDLGHYLIGVDLDNNSVDEIDFAFFAHGFAPNPVDPRRGVWFEKLGPGCCLVDMVDKRVERAIVATKGRHFYGHGAYAKDGSKLYSVESHLETFDGAIVVRDGKTFEPLGEFPSAGLRPHDCLLIDDGKTLAITNGGSLDGDTAEHGLPNVAFIDIDSTKVLERLTFDTPRINAGHLAITDSRDVVCISAPREGLPRNALGGVTMRTGKGPFTTMKEPAAVTARMHGEALSTSVHEATGVVGVTHPDGNMITFWNLKTKKLIKKMELVGPRGICQTLDHSRFVISYDPGRVALVTPATLEVVPSSELKTKVSGSHLFPWDPLV